MKMKEYNVTITETLTLTVPVEASSKEDALEIVCDGWHEGDYIVDWLDGVEFYVNDSSDPVSDVEEAGGCIKALPAATKEGSRIVINLQNGLNLVAEQNPDPNYRNEIFVGIQTSEGVWHQDLAIVRNAYSVEDNLAINWDPDKFFVTVFADKNNEDCTNIFSIGLYADKGGLER